MSLSARLSALNLTLPTVPAAVGAYIPAKRTGNLVFVAGQLPLKDGKLLATGPVPSRCAPEAAVAAARQCVLNAIAAAASAVGSVDQLKGIARVAVFVTSDASFTQQSVIANGASELLLELFGEPGRHPRVAVGMIVLPLDASVEVEVTFEV